MRPALAAALVALATLACNALVGFDDLTKQPALDAGSSDDDDGDDDDDDVVNGSSSSSGDAGSPDGGAVPACDPAADFGTPALLEGPVNSADFENSPGLTDDELTLVFQRTIGETSSIMIATRATAGAPFGAPSKLALTSSGLSFQPSLSRDGLTLFWAEAVAQKPTDIFFATRTTSNGAFANPFATGISNPSFAELTPVVTGDGDEMFYTSDQEGAKARLYHATRNGGEFGNSQKLQELADGSNGEEESVAVSKDGLTVFFASSRTGGPGQLDIWTARRNSRSEKFTGVALVKNVNSNVVEWPSFVSADGCRLYFGSDRTGDGDLYVATRGR